MSSLVQLLHSLIFVLAESAPYVVLGYLIAAIIREFLPEKFLSRWLGPHGVAPLFKALGIGALLPICSCGTIPLGIGLVKNGAARGTVLSFMTAAPALSPVALLLGLNLLGRDFMMIHVSVVLVGAFTIGWLGNLLFEKKKRPVCTTTYSLEDLQSKSSCPSKIKPSGFKEREEWIQEADRSQPWYRRIQRAFHWAFFDLGAEVSLDLLFGITLASVVVTFVSPMWIHEWLGGMGLSSLLMVIVLSIPVYTCSVPSIPVVRNLLLMGASPGVAVAYLIAGPATNLGELNAIRKGFGGKPAVFYALGLLVVALTGGLWANHWFQSATEESASSSQSVWLQVQMEQNQIADSTEQWSHRMMGEGNLYDTKELVQALGRLEKIHWISGSFLALTLAIGSYKKIRVLIFNPCKHCQFWNDVSKDVRCSGPCWLKKAHLWIRRYF